jgi:hypothetical protein
MFDKEGNFDNQGPDKVSEIMYMQYRLACMHHGFCQYNGAQGQGERSTKCSEYQFQNTFITLNILLDNKNPYPPLSPCGNDFNGKCIRPCFDGSRFGEVIKLLG